MAIYTKTGDKGETKVFDKESGELIKIGKDSCRIKTIGAIDELNSYLGIVGNRLSQRRNENRMLVKKIERIQGNLFTINSILAGGKLKFNKNEIGRLERQIDEWEGKLPVQTNFIYYGGGEVASLLFYARSLVRRAERELTEFSRLEIVPESIKSYLNRLSDYLFIMARNSNFYDGIKERYWISKKSQ